MKPSLVWLLVVAASAGCASSPPMTTATAATAAIDAVRGGVPACEPGHERALVNGVVAIHPGETICLGMKKDATGIIPLAVVDSGTAASSVVVVRFWLEGDQSFLSVHNPFPSNIKYRAGMLLAGENRPRATSSCPVLSRRMSLEHWPHRIAELLLTDFRFAPQDARCD